MLTAGLPRPRRRVFVVIGLGVLAAHALLLGGIDAGLGADRGVAAMPPAVQVREVTPPAPAPATVPAAATAPAPVPPATPAPPPRRPRAARPPVETAAVAAEPPAAAASAAAEPAVVAEAVPGPEPAAAAHEAAVAASASASAPPAIAESAPVPAGGEAPPPTYPTRLPPAATLRYDLQRGRIGGAGALRWQPDGARYALRLDGSVVGLVVLMQESAGTLGAAGLAPQRFTDQRARRATLAANFDRAGRRVTFSGAPQELPLHEGAQDRLSWMVQLAAIAAADPARAEADAKTALQVVGARGDSSVWVFRSLGTEPVATRDGPIDALHLVREPRGPHDTGVEVWLDPARHHLPVRATMRNGADGEVLELTLRDLTVGG